MSSSRVFITVPVRFACPPAAKPIQRPYTQPSRPYQYGSNRMPGQSHLPHTKSTFLAILISTLGAVLTPAVEAFDLDDGRDAWSLHEDQDASF